MAKLELRIIDPQVVRIVPEPEELAIVRADLMDIDRLPVGKIQIANGGANAFKVTEPGDDDDHPAMEVVGVIIHSHKVNAYWQEGFGVGENSPPDCRSDDGITGLRQDSFELVACDTCPLNQFGSDGKGKACRNGRMLYIMRDGDVLPLTMKLPPSALSACDKYRTKVALSRRLMHAVLTRITLRTEKGKGKGGADYSVPVFEAVAQLPPAEAERVRQYADSFVAMAAKMGMADSERGRDFDNRTCGAGDAEYDAPAQTQVGEAIEDRGPVDEGTLPFGEDYGQL